MHQTHRKQSQAGPLVVQRIHERLLPGATEPTADGVASRPPHPERWEGYPQRHRMSNRGSPNRSPDPAPSSLFLRCHGSARRRPSVTPVEVYDIKCS